MITTQEVLGMLSIVSDNGWRRTLHGIRDRNGSCPLCALVEEVTGERFLNQQVELACNSIGIPYATMSDIVAQADIYVYSQSLRQALCMP